VGLVLDQRRALRSCNQRLHALRDRYSRP